MQNRMSDEQMQSMLEKLAQSDGHDEQAIGAALEEFPQDARLHFLKASIFAGAGRLIEAHAAFAKSIEIDPDFHIARFQFGLFQLTSGESDNALKTWARLDALPKDHYLRVFVIGLRQLIRDEIADCIATLEKGISMNQDNVPLNGDIQMLIEKVRPLLEDEAKSEDEADTDVSSPTSILLQQSKGTLH